MSQNYPHYPLSIVRLIPLGFWQFFHLSPCGTHGQGGHLPAVAGQQKAIKPLRTWRKKLTRGRCKPLSTWHEKATGGPAWHQASLDPASTGGHPIRVIWGILQRTQAEMIVTYVS